MEKAKLTKVAGKLLIHTPYNSHLVDEIRGIPGRRWNPDLQAWSVPVESEQQVRDLVRQFYQIEGEPCYVEYEIIRVKVTGEGSAKRTHTSSVTVDGREIFNPYSGYLDMRANGSFEILEHVGGFVKGDGYVRHGRGHAFAVAYTLKMRVRKEAEWETRGSGTYEFLPPESPVDEFLRSVLEKESAE